jgi:hypothetical protein
VNRGAGSATAGRETLDQSGRAFQTGQVGLRCFVMPRRSKHVPGQRPAGHELGRPAHEIRAAGDRAGACWLRHGSACWLRHGPDATCADPCSTQIARAPVHPSSIRGSDWRLSRSQRPPDRRGTETSVKEATLQTAINADPTASVLRTVQGGIPGALQRCRRPVVGPVRPCHVRGDRSLWPVGADLGSIRASQRPEPGKEQP